MALDSVKPKLSDDLFFSLVVLCYRAEESIVPFVTKLNKVLSLYNFRWEIVLVANYNKGQKDRTPEVVQNLTKEFSNVTYVSEPKEGMMGWDLRKGLDVSRGEYIGLIDGDGQFPIDAIFSCLSFIVSEDLDLVKTYRVKRGDGFLRSLISFVYNCLFRLLFGSTCWDANSKPKIFRKSAYQRMGLISSDWFIDAEIMIRAKELELKVGEIPITFFSQKGRTSFVKISAINEFIRNLFKGYVRHKKFLKQQKNAKSRTPTPTST
jgi:glycosyltransferase involved in cell wall biosynthesis